MDELRLALRRLSNARLRAARTRLIDSPPPMRPLAIAVAAALMLGARASSSPQNPERPQFKIGIDVRQLDVVVLDREGRPVRGLTAADFTILEDGKPQKIAAIEEIVVPGSTVPQAVWMREVAPDVRTNSIPVDGRLIVIVMDDAMTRDPELIEPARRIGRAVINEMGPADLAAVVYTARNQHSQDFTSDRSRLLAAVERMRSGLASGAGDQFAMEPTLRGYSIGTLARASEYLRAIEGRRKVLLYVSVGVPVDWADISTPVANLGEEGVTVGGKEAMRDLGQHLRAALHEAALSNVAVYALSPRGLTVDDFRLEREFLQTMSESTGGFAVVNTNTPEARVNDVFAANAGYYLLAYEIQRPDDGRYRRLDVKVNRSGVFVHARKGFFAARPGPRPARDGEPAVSPLATAMAGFLPKGDVPMQAGAFAIALPGKAEAGVAIVARVQQPPVTRRAVHHVELLTTAFDPHGAARSSKRQNARVTMLPSGTHVAEYEVLSRIDLAPGRYSLRIAAHNPAIEKSGSVFCDLDVPDFRKDGLWLSSVALAVKPGVAAAPRGALSDLLPIVPTTVRDFAADDEVQGFVQVVQGGRSALRSVTVHIRVVDGSDAIVHRAGDTLESAMFSATRVGEYGFTVPVGGLRPGAYLLTIETRAGERAARREIRFTRR